MQIFRFVIQSWSSKERMVAGALVFVFCIAFVGRIVLAVGENSALVAVEGGYYTEGILGQPIAINPIISANQVDLDMSALLYSNLLNLISHYEVKDKGRTYVLKLKEGLVWDDTTPLTSDDVVFTIETIQNPETRSPLFKNLEGVVVERLSELNVQIALPNPYAFFLHTLGKIPIIPKHIFGSIPNANLRLSEYNLKPVGSGPYKFADFVKRGDGFFTSYHFTANELYGGQAPYLKDFYFKFYSKEEDLGEALRTREIQGTGSITPFHNERILGLNYLTAEDVLTSQYYAIFLNQGINPIFKNADIRKALLRGLDRDAIVRDVFEGRGTPIESPYLGFQKSTEENIGYDSEAAKELLEKGKKKLKIEKIELNLIVPRIPFLSDTARIAKRNWETIGIDTVNVIELDTQDILENVIKPRNYEMVLFGNILDHPLDLFPFWHSSERFYPGLNLSLYANEKVDRFMEAIRQTENYEKKLELVQQAASLIRDDIPAFFIASIPYTYIHVNSAHPTLPQIITTPEDRFERISDWYTKTVRVLK